MYADWQNFKCMHIFQGFRLCCFHYPIFICQFRFYFSKLFGFFHVFFFFFFFGFLSFHLTHLLTYKCARSLAHTHTYPGFVVHRGRTIPTLASMQEPLPVARTRQSKERTSMDSKNDDRGKYWSIRTKKK